jgi:hypothetical protein
MLLGVADKTIAVEIICAGFAINLKYGLVGNEN